MNSYQVVTLVLSDGRRVSYTGKSQIDHINPPKVVDVIISISRPLPAGMTWETMPEPVEGEDKLHKAEYKCGRCGGENFACLECDNQVQ